MAMEKYKKPRPGTWQRRHTVPKLSIGTTGLVLNRKATERVGLDKKAVLLYFDREFDVIGLWFFQDKKTIEEAHDAYAVVLHSKYHTAKIAARTFIERFGLIKKVEKLGTSSFFLEYDKNYATGRDYYVARMVL